MRTIIFLLAISIISLFIRCKKSDTTQKATTKDTTTTVKEDTISKLVKDPNATKLILLRHAEKESTGSDPNLTSDGLLRAEELKKMLSNISINAIYSSSYNRTRQTVQNLSASKGITVAEYDASMPYQQLVDNILSANAKKTVVLVGHSNTIPEILKMLSNNTFTTTINEDQYDNLFIVVRPENGTPTVTHLKYGKATP